MDCLSHRSFISIQRIKNQNSKTKISQITNSLSSVFIYKKRDKRRREKEKRKKRGKKNKNKNPIISISNDYNF
jgi:hypothetical protein